MKFQSMVSQLRLNAALSALLLIASACSSRPYVERYFAEISKNQQSLSTLTLGMSAAEVRGLMGEGEIVRHKKLYLVDPWRTEAFHLKDGTDVLILYYVTTRPHRYHRATDAELTPIVLENDRVAGWGWSYLNRNLDRYQVAAPKEQR
jgi:hypothetical protein